MRRIAVAMALCFLVAACGDGDARSSTTAVAITEAPQSTTEVTTTSAAPVTTTTAAPETTTSTTTAPDTTPPELVVTSPPAGVTVADAEVVFLGVVEPGVQGVWANEAQEADVDGDGNWEVTLSLPSGHSNIVFSALDQAGNEALVEQAITYTAPMPCEGAEVLAEHGSTYPVGPKSWCAGGATSSR